MNHLNFSILNLAAFLTLTSFSAIAGGNEVGNNLFVAEPKSKPFFVNDSGDRYWNCEGLVSAKFIEDVYSDLSELSVGSNVPKPMLTPCHYSIGTIKIFNRVLYNYNIDFYTNKDLIKSCLTGKYCENRRTMTLKIINGNLYKQYTIIHSGKLSKMICVDLEGNIVNKNNGCTN